MEHLTRMNSTTIITDKLWMLYLMKGVLNETNSSHTTRKHLERINTYGKWHKWEQKLNTDPVMNLINSENHFHYYFQKCLQSYNPDAEASKIWKSNQPLSSFEEVIFILQWILIPTLKQSLISITKFGDQILNHYNES